MEKLGSMMSQDNYDNWKLWDKEPTGSDEGNKKILIDTSDLNVLTAPRIAELLIQQYGKNIEPQDLEKIGLALNPVDDAKKAAVFKELMDAGEKLGTSAQDKKKINAILVNLVYKNAPLEQIKEKVEKDRKKDPEASSSSTAPAADSNFSASARFTGFVPTQPGKAHANARLDTLANYSSDDGKITVKSMISVEHKAANSKLEQAVYAGKQNSDFKINNLTAFYNLNKNFFGGASLGTTNRFVAEYQYDLSAYTLKPNSIIPNRGNYANAESGFKGNIISNENHALDAELSGMVGTTGVTNTAASQSGVNAALKYRYENSDHKLEMNVTGTGFGHRKNQDITTKPATAGATNSGISVLSVTNNQEITSSRSSDFYTANAKLKYSYKPLGVSATAYVGQSFEKLSATNPNLGDDKDYGTQYGMGMISYQLPESAGVFKNLSVDVFAGKSSQTYNERANKLFPGQVAAQGSVISSDPYANPLNIQQGRAAKHGKIVDTNAGLRANYAVGEKAVLSVMGQVNNSTGTQSGLDSANACDKHGNNFYEACKNKVREIYVGFQATLKFGGN